MEELMFIKQNNAIDSVVDEIADRIVKMMQSFTKEEISSMLSEQCQTAYRNRRAMFYANRVPLLETFSTEEEFSEKFFDIKKQLCNIFELKQWQVRLYDFADIGDELAAVYSYYDAGMDYDKLMSVIVPNSEANIKVISNYMRKNGYFFLRSAFRQLEEDEPQSQSADTICIMFFCPVKMKDVSAEVRKMGDDLLHITAKSNLESILRDGLKPQARTGLSDIYYPPRIYFFSALAPHEYVNEYSEMLSKEHNDEDMVCLSIEVSQLPADMKIYYDPLIGKYAVFVEDSIPPKAIYIVDNEDEYDV